MQASSTRSSRTTVRRTASSTASRSSSPTRPTTRGGACSRSSSATARPPGRGGRGSSAGESAALIRKGWVFRPPPPLLNASSTSRLETENGHWSQSRNHARLHRVQAAELSDAEVEAELARPGGVQEVLPLVRPAHPASGDPLARVYGEADASTAARAARTTGAGPRGRAAPKRSD